ncbi:MAG: HAD family hydrolase, partial [Dehalococcoidia bacterium]
RRGAGPSVPAPGAVDVLEEARRRDLALGLVSVTGLTPGYVLREILDDLGMLRHFGALTFSDEARMAKPAAEVFHCTLEVLGAAPREAVFVGDTPFADIAGPQAIGMWAVQVGARQQDGVEPHARVDALSELFPAIERLGLLD